MSQQLEKYLPVPDNDSREFWESCSSEVFTLQHCRACGEFRFPPSPNCPICLSADFDLSRAEGLGSIYSFVIVHEPLVPGWKDELPYVVAIVELAEGPHVVSNIVDIPIDQITVGMAVKLKFVRVSEQLILPKFQPAVV